MEDQSKGNISWIEDEEECENNERGNQFEWKVLQLGLCSKLKIEISTAALVQESKIKHLNPLSTNAGLRFKQIIVIIFNNKRFKQIYFQ